MSSNATALWTLLLTTGGQRKIVKLPPTASIEALYENQSETCVLVRARPPRTTLPRSAVSLQEAGLQSQDRLLIEEPSASASKKESKKGPKKGAKGKKIEKVEAEEETATHTFRTSNKRAAAKRASEFIAENPLPEEEVMVPAKRRNTSPYRKPPPARPKTSRTGYRLHDGASITAPKRRKRKEVSQDNAIEALVDGTSNTILRKGWKQAVQDAFEQNKAAARIAAVQANKFQIQVTNNVLMVSYAKGIQGRGGFHEQVPALALPVLQEVIRQVHPAEALKPGNLALLSLRVFWNVVHHTQSFDVSRVVPDLDWSYLQARPRQLSAKARENLRQQQKEDEQPTNWEAAAEAIESVEQAMGETLQAADREEARQARLRALDRQSGGAFRIVTPSEEDRDELVECMQSDEHVEDMVTKCGIHNWRELANSTVIELKSVFPSVSDEALTSWIAEAQTRSLDEIMMEICDGDAASIRLLYTASAGTPKDLAVWRGIADVLQAQLGPEAPSASKLAAWCNRSKQAMDQLEWLAWYATPLADASI